MGLDLSAVATELLSTLGSTTNVKITRITGQVVDPVLGTKTGGTPTTTFVNSAVTKVDKDLFEGSRISANDLMIVIDNKYKPLMSDQIEIGNIPFKIVEIREKNHAGIPQVYFVVVGKV